MQNSKNRKTQFSNTQNRVPKLKEEKTQFSNTEGEGMEQKYS